MGPFVDDDLRQPVERRRLLDHRRVGSDPADRDDQRRKAELAFDRLLQGHLLFDRQIRQQRDQRLLADLGPWRHDQPQRQLRYVECDGWEGRPETTQAALGQQDARLLLQDGLGRRLQLFDFSARLGESAALRDAGRLRIGLPRIGVEPLDVALQPPGLLDQPQEAPHQVGPLGLGQIADIPDAILAELDPQRAQRPAGEIELDRRGEAVQLVGGTPVGTGAAAEQHQRQRRPKGEGEDPPGHGHGGMIPSAGSRHP